MTLIWPLLAGEVVKLTSIHLRLSSQQYYLSGQKTICLHQLSRLSKLPLLCILCCFLIEPTTGGRARWGDGTSPRKWWREKLKLKLAKKDLDLETLDEMMMVDSSFKTSANNNDEDDNNDDNNYF